MCLNPWSVLKLFKLLRGSEQESLMFAFISLCSFLLLLFFSFFVFQGDVVMQNFYNNFFSKISLKTFVWRKIQLISSSRDILKSLSLTYQLYRVKSNAV